MSDRELEQLVFTFKPASYTGNETFTLFTVRDGYFAILSAVVRIETLFNGTPSIIVGYSGATSDLVAAADVTETSAAVYKGAGTGLANGGALYPPGRSVILTYTGHASTTTGLARIAITGYRLRI